SGLAGSALAGSCEVGSGLAAGAASSRLSDARGTSWIGAPGAALAGCRAALAGAGAALSVSGPALAVAGAVVAGALLACAATAGAGAGVAVLAGAAAAVAAGAAADVAAPRLAMSTTTLSPLMKSRSGDPAGRPSRATTRSVMVEDSSDFRL